MSFVHRHDCCSRSPGNWISPEPNVVVKEPPPALNATCETDDLIDGTNVKKCEDVCRAASCCTNRTDNCFLFDGPLGCLGYPQCALLYRSPFLEETCSWDNVTAGMEQPCVDWCEPPLCCVPLKAPKIVGLTAMPLLAVNILLAHSCGWRVERR